MSRAILLKAQNWSTAPGACVYVYGAKSGDWPKSHDKAEPRQDIMMSYLNNECVCMTAPHNPVFTGCNFDITPFPKSSELGVISGHMHTSYSNTTVR